MIVFLKTQIGSHGPGSKFKTISLNFEEGVLTLYTEESEENYRLFLSVGGQIGS